MTDARRGRIREIAAYYIPAVDNLLDTVTTPAALVAGTLVAAAVMADLPPIVKWTTAIIAGGGAAGHYARGDRVATYKVDPRDRRTRQSRHRDRRSWVAALLISRAGSDRAIDCTRHCGSALLGDVADGAQAAQAQALRWVTRM